MNEVRMKLSPPWITMVNEIMMLFGEDPDITIKYNNDFHEVKIYINDAEKAKALQILLPTRKDFGNVIFYITVIPPNSESKKLENINAKMLFEMAFKNNPVFSFCHTVEGIFSNNITYVVFKNKVVQFFNDNLNDIYGNITTLYEDIARDILDKCYENVFYCTDVADNSLKKSNWP